MIEIELRINKNIYCFNCVFHFVEILCRMCNPSVIQLYINWMERTASHIFIQDKTVLVVRDLHLNSSGSTSQSLAKVSMSMLLSTSSCEEVTVVRGPFEWPSSETFLHALNIYWSNLLKINQKIRNGTRISLRFDTESNLMLENQ